MTDFKRRAFVQMGLSAATATMLAACITKRKAPPPNEQPRSAAGPLESELRIFNWSDYIAAETIARFEREFKVRVSYDTFESNEEMVAKLVAGGGGYDIVAPTSYLVPVLAEGGLLAPLDHAVLHGWRNLLPAFLEAPSDRGGRYAMPYQWGTTGIAYRADLVPTTPTSWGVFSDASLGGKTTMLDDGREVIGTMLKWRGHSINSTIAAELAAAERDAIAVKPHLRAYISAPVKGQLVSGDVLVAQLFSPDARQAQLEEPRVQYVIPSEGSEIYLDTLAIPRDAPHRRAAHAFLDYLLRPAVAAEIADQTGGGPVNGAAIPLMRLPVSPPDQAQLARLEYQRDLGAATDQWDRLWTEIKSA
ncbi:MAG: spermidine/putrescine ABC transporter substrate-binding protein [Gemmatimonadales bacterium]